MINKNLQYIGTGWSFPPSFNNDINTVETVNGVQEIVQSLKILFNTTPGERIMLERFGAGMKDVLFENLDVSMINMIKERVKYVIEEFESRINIVNLDFDINQLEGKIDVHIDFEISSSNTRVNIVYPFYTIEATDVPN